MVTGKSEGEMRRSRLSDIDSPVNRRVGEIRKKVRSCTTEDNLGRNGK